MCAQVTGRGPMERLVVAATMGPTIHQTHAWRFAVLDDAIEVRADPGRFRPRHDPYGRGLHLSCGAALINMRLAAAQLRLEPVVRLLPDSGRPTLLATVRLAGRHRVDRLEGLLYAATLKPFPRPGPYETGRPPADVLGELAAAARLEGCSLRNVAGDGVHAAAITTDGDAPVDWLRAGQALQRVLLIATIRGVSSSFRYERGTQAARLPHGEVPQVMLEMTHRARTPAPTGNADRLSTP